MKLFRKSSMPSGAAPFIIPAQDEFSLFPLLPLREIVIFPQTMMPLYITYRAGISALEEAVGGDMRVFAVCLKNNETPGAKYDEICDTGTVARIHQHIRLPDSTYRIILQGEYRARIVSKWEPEKSPLVKTEPLRGNQASGRGETLENLDIITAEISALIRAVQKSFVQYAEFTKKISTEIQVAVEKTENAERLVNIAGNSAAIKVDRKIELLSIADPKERLEKLLEILETENEILGIQKTISGKVKSRMEKNQREFILNEQLREIHKQLGKEGIQDEYSEIEQAIAEKKPPEEVLLKAGKEIGRLRKLQPFSPEAGVLRTYLEWIADLPWNDYSGDNVSEAGAEAGALQAAEKILNEDHFGMKKAKERIIEFIAVRQLTLSSTSDSAQDTANEGASDLPLPALAPLASGKNAFRGPILCFVGPPGTGKTSLGKSIARALDRRFVRISLGGVRDEAEIRGHRKTYVGALPGKIIQSMKKALVMNPVFLLDEIDKLSTDFRGDPASALLEVLDPEQNSTFTDHYLEVPYDLSNVLFITTANSLHSIPYPLLDRMEIIEIPGYGENEKLAIAKNFLVPKELRENGLGRAKITFQDEALREIIRRWTMESGVRGLEREIARCARRIAREAVNKEYGKSDGKPIEAFKKNIKKENLEKLLGRRKYKNDVVFKEARTGVSYGLAWTETGGAILPVESISSSGSGELIITGNLGDVMKESARIALSYLKSVRDQYDIKEKSLEKTDFHIHVPEGAIPKDGPSAGITLACSILSTICRIPPKPAIAMTGELTLTGRVLPIGGLKEKLLAAIRNGMKKVILPNDNREDWAELDEDICNALEAEFVETADSVFLILFDKKILKKNAGAQRAAV
ncbi:MAG: endopeptidase La [Treponema sp.]|jgi:ATP-dependent Lon protease|nr:endopeptidase La [Treponema sp.]